jgi:RHS repeat-associated protein
MKTSRKIMAPVIMRRLLQATVVCLVAFTSLNAPALERVTYYHNDALGSPVAATDSSGNLLWREEYEPYGERILREDGGTNSLWFTGKQEEEAFGISYFGARWYDPGIGRFMGVDPIGFNSDDIQSFNRYAYACGRSSFKTNRIAGT